MMLSVGNGARWTSNSETVERGCCVIGRMARCKGRHEMNWLECGGLKLELTAQAHPLALTHSEWGKSEIQGSRRHSATKAEPELGLPKWKTASAQRSELCPSG